MLCDKALLAICVAVHPKCIGWSWGQLMFFHTKTIHLISLLPLLCAHMTLRDCLRLTKGPSSNSLIPRAHRSQRTGVLTGFLYSFLQLTTCERVDLTECTSACHIWCKCHKWVLYSCKDGHWRVEYKSRFQRNRGGWSSRVSRRPWLTFEDTVFLIFFMWSNSSRFSSHLVQPTRECACTFKLLMWKSSCAFMLKGGFYFDKASCLQWKGERGLKRTTVDSHNTVQLKKCASNLFLLLLRLLFLLLLLPNVPLCHFSHSCGDEMFSLLSVFHTSCTFSCRLTCCSLDPTVQTAQSSSSPDLLLSPLSVSDPL